MTTNGPVPATVAVFEWLYDGLPEDGLEAAAYLRADLAATPEEAAAKMTELYERDKGPLSAYGDGRSFAPASDKHWRRAQFTVFDDDCEEIAELHGEAAVLAMSRHDRLDELLYVKCNANDEGACEWWHVPLVWP